MKLATLAAVLLFLLSSAGAVALTDADKAAQTHEWLSGMRKSLKEVLDKLEEAKASKDVVKLNCVNEKYTQIKGLVRISEQAESSLKDGLTKQDPLTVDHEYTKVSIAKQKVDQLRAETEECIGQLAFRTDEKATIEVEEPKDLPNDPSRGSEAPPVLSRPPAGSPTL